MSELIYIETWEVKDSHFGNRLQIAYTESLCPTYEHLVVLRSCMAEKNHCKLKYLIREKKIEGVDND